MDSKRSPEDQPLHQFVAPAVSHYPEYWPCPFVLAPTGAVSPSPDENHITANILTLPMPSRLRCVLPNVSLFAPDTPRVYLDTVRTFLASMIFFILVKYFWPNPSHNLQRCSWESIWWTSTVAYKYNTPLIYALLLCRAVFFSAKHFLDLPSTFRLCRAYFLLYLFSFSSAKHLASIRLLF